MADPVEALVSREPAREEAELQVPELTPEDVAFPELPPAPDDITEAEKKVRTMTAGRIAKARLRAKLLFSLRAQQYSYGEIAQITGLSVNAVKKALKRARAAGVGGESIQKMLAQESTELAVESLNHHLRNRDKSMTIAHLKGMGHYRNYSHNKSEGMPGFTMPALQVNVTVQNGEALPPGAAIDVSDGAIGVPRTDD